MALFLLENPEILNQAKPTGDSAQCCAAAWTAGEFGRELVPVYVWLSSLAFHLTLSRHCLLIGYTFSCLVTWSCPTLVTPWSVAHQAPLSMEFSRQEYRSGLPFLPAVNWLSVQFSCSVVSNTLRPHEPQHARPSCPSATPGVHPNPCSLSL